MDKRKLGRTKQNPKDSGELRGVMENMGKPSLELQEDILNFRRHLTREDCKLTFR